MAKIWLGDLTLAEINRFNKNTLGEALEINFTEMGDDYLTAIMPVNHKTVQPFGILHGGASVALAETLGSVASLCLVDREKFMGVGVEINANHLAMATKGVVKGVCRPIRHIGRLHVWEIKISDEEGQLCCISRFTCMVVPKR